MIRFLQQNNSAVKVLFAIIIGFAIVTMVITLVPGIFDGASANDANVFATVRDPGFFGRFGGGAPIKQTEVNQLASRQLQQQRLPEFLMPYMAQRAGQILVQREILKQQADKMHLQVSDADLRRELETGPFAQYLFPNGAYIGDDAYINFVQSAFQTSRTDFEEQVKNDMELNRLQALITGGVTVSDNAVRDAERVQGTKVKFDYAVISSEELGKTITPTEAQLADFFKQNQARYATAVPETRKIQYVTFDANSLPGGKPAVTDAEIQQYYTQHGAQYQVKEQVRVRHILIAASGGRREERRRCKGKGAGSAEADSWRRQFRGAGREGFGRSGEQGAGWRAGISESRADGSGV